MQGLNGRVCNPKKQTGGVPWQSGAGSPGGCRPAEGGEAGMWGYYHWQGQTLLAAGGRCLGSPGRVRGGHSEQLVIWGAL